MVNTTPIGAGAGRLRLAVAGIDVGGQGLGVEAGDVAVEVGDVGVGVVAGGLAVARRWRYVIVFAVGRGEVGRPAPEKSQLMPAASQTMAVTAVFLMKVTLRW